METRQNLGEVAKLASFLPTMLNVLWRKRTNVTFGANWEASFATYRIHTSQVTSRKSRECRLIRSGTLEKDGGSRVSLKVPWVYRRDNSNTTYYFFSSGVDVRTMWTSGYTAGSRLHKVIR
ncbi:hypothetical protein TNCV_1461731 [Trichonephila clavipes]|nr:hypothetical protein TNCV_1461731 [Trichonephila clavipes]